MQMATDKSDHISDKRAKSLANLRPPFKKGEINNPKGRPPVKHITDAIKEALAGTLKVKENGKVIEVNALEAIIRAQMMNAARGDVKAARFLTEHGFGKAVQTQIVQGEVTVRTTPEREEADKLILQRFIEQHKPQGTTIDGNARDLDA